MKYNRSVNKEEVKGLVCRTNSHRWSPKQKEASGKGAS